jgi:hypothetical protein
MTRLVSLALLTSLVACVDDAETGSHTLPADGHYVIVPNGYASPEECLANAQQPFACQYSLSLCANGRAGERIGDLVDQGTYNLHGSVAHVDFDSGETMQFDVQAVVDLDSPNVQWIIDTEQRWNTLQFDNIDCGHNY